jgi:hypothetical protein
MGRVTIAGLDTYYGPIPTAFETHSKYTGNNYYIQPWWVINLNEYQRDNLILLISLILERGGLLNTLNTGDWIAEFLHMLAKPELDGTRVVPKYTLDEDDKPNISLKTAKEQLIGALAYKIKKVEDISLAEAMEKAEAYWYA